MNENWVMVCLGPLLVFLGIAATAVSGAMPDAKPLYPVPLRLRLILIAFGVFMFALGAARLIQK